MLEWHPEPGSMQGGKVQCDNHLAFAQHNKKGKGERIEKYTRTSPVTSAANSDTVEDHVYSRNMNKKN